MKKRNTLVEASISVALICIVSGLIYGCHQAQIDQKNAEIKRLNKQLESLGAFELEPCSRWKHVHLEKVTGPGENTAGNNPHK
jgi:hypothetical protein